MQLPVVFIFQVNREQEIVIEIIPTFTEARSMALGKRHRKLAFTSKWRPIWGQDVTVYMPIIAYMLVMASERKQGVYSLTTSPCSYTTAPRSRNIWLISRMSPCRKHNQDKNGHIISDSKSFVLIARLTLSSNHTLTYSVIVFILCHICLVSRVRGDIFT